MPGLYVKRRISENSFEIAGGAPHGDVPWQVTGSRKDAYARAHPVIVDEEKGAGTAAAYPKGRLIHAEAGTVVADR